MPGHGLEMGLYSCEPSNPDFKSKAFQEIRLLNAVVITLIVSHKKQINLLLTRQVVEYSSW